MSSASRFLSYCRRARPPELPLFSERASWLRLLSHALWRLKYFSICHQERQCDRASRRRQQISAMMSAYCAHTASQHFQLRHTACAHHALHVRAPAPPIGRRWTAGARLGHESLLASRDKQHVTKYRRYYAYAMEFLYFADFVERLMDEADSTFRLNFSSIKERHASMGARI